MVKDPGKIVFTIRMIITWASQYAYEEYSQNYPVNSQNINQMDVSNAILNGYLNDDEFWLFGIFFKQLQSKDQPKFNCPVGLVKGQVDANVESFSTIIRECHRKTN